MANYTSSHTGSVIDNVVSNALLKTEASSIYLTQSTFTNTLNNYVTKTELNNALTNRPIIRCGYKTGQKQSNSNLGSATVYYTQVSIDFGYTFTNSPIVLVSANDLAGGVFAAEVDGTITTTGCTVTIYGADTSNYGVYWAAIGN